MTVEFVDAETGEVLDTGTGTKMPKPEVIIRAVSITPTPMRISSGIKVALWISAILIVGFIAFMAGAMA